MRILVTGANGQVGHELLRALASVGAVEAATGSRFSPPLPVGGPEGPTHDASMWRYATDLPPVDPSGSPARITLPVGGPEGPTGPRVSPPQGAGHSPSQAGAVPVAEIIPATRSGRLEDGTFCERIDLADPGDLRKALDRIAPDLIINAAAYTAVDRAEDEPDLAQCINGDAVGVLGRWAKQHGARVVHYSTDYVFDGSAARPYGEDGATQPLGVYGRSKLAGEIALRDSGARYLIFRTAWVYAAHGRNFLRTMLRLGAERDELRVVDDQIGAPTPARLIADVTAQVVAQWCDDHAPTRDGTYHLVASGQTSWCGFARAIFERAQRAEIIQHAPHVTAITTADYPTRAARPAYSMLDTSRLRATFGVELPDWQSSLDGVIAELRT